ncbi:MAG: ATP-binding protein, partial [Candidatus Omnitrophica bacterium]|nr:ATP-binding protein [Candidatus Omnitrophota bacterium]
MLVRDWQKIFDAMDIGITISDKNGYFEIFNSKMQAITGYTLEQVNACGDFSRVIYPDPLERQEALERLNEIMQKPGCHEIETQIQAKDGTKKILSVSTSLINYKDRVIFLSVYQDVTRRRKDEQTLKQVKDELEIQTWGQQKTNMGIKVLYKELEIKTREAEKLNQAKSDFISTVSHELRTPLTIIREGVSQVLDGILGDTTAEQREFLSICLADIDRLERIINNLLDISKVEAGKIQLKKGLVDIISIAKGIVSFFGPQAKEKGLELKPSYSEEKIYAYVDADKITQAFTNLVGNALKFTEKGYIEISVEEKGNNVECAVADTGIGISSGDLSRVFDKFQQFGRVAGGGEKGTGLGLSIAKGIVDLHNGKIWVESEINKGTKFCFTFPKYTKEEILCESIGSKIEIAKKEGKEVSLLLFKFDNYKEAEKIYGEEKLQRLFLMISEILKEVVRSGGLVIEGSADEIILLEEVVKQNIPRMNARLKRAIKESIFEFEKERKIIFSQGYATYPNDAANAKDLLKKARLAMVSESQERLKKNIMIVDDEPVVIDALERLLSKLGYNNFIKAHDGDEALAKIKNLTP